MLDRTHADIQIAQTRPYDGEGSHHVTDPLSDQIQADTYGIHLESNLEIDAAACSFSFRQRSHRVWRCRKYQLQALEFLEGDPPIRFSNPARTQQADRFRFEMLDHQRR